MKVLLIGNLAEDRQESMLRFTAMLQSGLESRGHAVTVLAPTLRLARRGQSYRYDGLPKYLGYFDKFVLFPRQLRSWIKSAQPDVVHIADHSNAMYVSAVEGVPVVGPCHDLLQVRAACGEVPHQAVGRVGRRYQSWIRTSLGRLDGVACVSARTRADVLRLTPLSPTQVKLIPNALNYPYQPIAAPTARDRLADLCVRRGFDGTLLHPAEGGYLLHVGGDPWYKNREGLLVIYAELRRLIYPVPRLVMVGPPLNSSQAALASKLGVTEYLVPLSSVTNPELEALYTLAEGLVFPSWEEGFGWPIAEAQACGCPVFTSNREPMTDVGGRSSIYFDPANPIEAAQTIAAAWPDRTARRAPALAEATRWQLAPMLDAYEALYRQLIP